MVLPGFNSPVQILIQGQDSNKAPPVHMLLPGHFIAKEVQAAVVCFVQTTVVATDVETELVENLKKAKEMFFFVKLEPPPGSPGPAPLVAGRAGRWWWLGGFVPPWPQASEWSDCWDADCACNATSDGSLHS